MSLNLSQMTIESAKPAKVATPKMQRLPKSYLPMIVEYANAVSTKKKAEADARAADSVIKRHRESLKSAMDGSETAICEHAVLTLSQTPDAPAAVTLNNGEKILWVAVESLLVGNRHVPREDIGTIFGGRSGGIKLDVKGV